MFIKRLSTNKFFVGILSIFMVSICLLLNGCIPALMGLKPGWIYDLNDKLESGEIDQEEYDRQFTEWAGGIEIGGVKVLRRPSSYDYTNNSYCKIDYYQDFARNIFENINKIYGATDQGYQAPQDEDGIILVEGDNIFQALSNVCEGNQTLKKLADDYTYGGAEGAENKEYFKYFYDALRYQVIGEEEKTAEDDSKYTEVTVNLNKGWNWFKSTSETIGYVGFRYDSEYVDDEGKDVDLRSFIAYPGNFAKDASGKRLDLNIDGATIKSNVEIGKFSMENVSTYYKDISTAYSSKIAFEDFSYALGYAIYSIVLGLPVNDIGWEANEFKVEGYDAVIDNPETTENDEGKSSSEVAFEALKEVFEKNGSYVGLTTKDKENISRYILENVVGSDAQSYGKRDLYYSDIIPAIVEYCGKLTRIGKSTGGNTEVGGNFLASEIVDFPGTSFFVTDNDDDEFENITSCEYQSIILMPKRQMRITDIWLDFKYIARNGNIKLEDKSLYLDIVVSVNWWTGTEMKTLKEKIRVYNDSFDPGTENSFMMFEFDTYEWNGGFGKGNPIVVGEFECDEIDASKNGVRDETSGLNKITLNGEVDARLYYELNQAEHEGVISYGATGRLNNERIAAEHPNMSYVEINFDVAKPAGDFSRNYDFYVGFSQLFDSTIEYDWVQ